MLLVRQMPNDICEPDTIAGLAAALKEADATWLAIESIRRGESPFTQEEEEALGIVGDPQPFVMLQYAWILTAAIDGLGALPEFADGQGLAALQALRIDLVALHAGANPARLKRQTGDGSANTGQRIARANVVLCVRLLEAIGINKSAARDRVAKIFGAAGHVGQQRKPLSAITINTWYDEISGADAGGPYAAARRFVESELAKWTQSPSWPPETGSALAFVERRAGNPLFSLAHTT